MERLWTKLSSSRSLRWTLAFGVTLYALLVCWAMVFPATLQDSEVGVHFVVLKLLAGGPIYPSGRDGAFYGLLYGPLTYLLYLPPFLIAPTSFTLTKAYSLSILVLAAVITGWEVCRVNRDVRHRLGVALMGTALLLYFKEFAFAPKAEPMLLLLAAVGVSCMRLRHAMFYLAALAAVMANIKPSAVVALMPILYLAHARWKPSARQTVVAAFLFALLLVLPYCLPFSSVAEYWALLRNASQHGLSPAMFALNLSLILVLGVVPFALGLLASDRVFWTLLLAAAVVLALAGSKAMTGSYHLLPLLPAYLYGLASGLARRRAAGLPFFKAVLGIFGAAMLLLGLPFQTAAYVLAYQKSSDLEREAVRQAGYFAERYPQLAVDGGQFPSLEARVARSGGQLHLSYWSLLDLALAGHSLPGTTAAALADCRIPFFVTVNGKPPFFASYEVAGRVVEPYGETFRRVFHEHYRPVDTSTALTLWKCRK
jgi:hypothetical protein